MGQNIATAHYRHQLADQFLGVGNAPRIVGRLQLTEMDIKQQIGDGGAGMLFAFVNYKIGCDDGQSDERVELLYQFREWETKNSDKI